MSNESLPNSQELRVQHNLDNVIENQLITIKLLQELKNSGKGFARKEA